MRDSQFSSVVVVLCVTAALAAAPAAAIEVKLINGTVIEAESYTMTGSFIMLTLPNGARQAYAVEDVDLTSLEQGETAEEAEPSDETAGEQPQQQASGLGGTAFGGAVAKAKEGESALVVTDDDVGHVPAGSRSEEEGEEGEEEEGEEAGASGGSGRVVISSFRVNPDKGNRYKVEGRVRNESSGTVINIRASMTIGAATTEVAVAGSLPPGGEASFTHSFVHEGKAKPNVSNIQVHWMAQDAGAAAGAGG